MANIAARIGMKVTTIIGGIPVGIITKKVVERAWAMARPDDPPRKPSEAGVRWGDAISWAALSAAGVVVADLMTRKGAESAWRNVIGIEPPAPKPGKARKSPKPVEGDLSRAG